MAESTKLKRLAELSEKALRDTVLGPLLARMGYKGVTAYHGPQERGKDIICYREDELGEREYQAVVAKAVDLSGSVSSADGLPEVLHQVEQCFNVPYEELFGVTRVSMHRVWVVTSKKIIPGAQESIFEKLRKTNLDKVTRFISGERLVELIDQYYPAFWDAALEPVDIVREQKGRLLHFCRQLLVGFGGNERDIDETLNQVVHGFSVPPVVVPATRELTSLSPYKAEIDTISEPFSHGFGVYACGAVRNAFFRTRESLYNAMRDLEEVIWHYEDVMKKTDPKEFVREFNESLGKDYPFDRATWGSAGDAVSWIGYLEQGIDELEDLKARLKEANKLEWATTLVDSVSKLEPDITSFLEHLEKENFSLYWRIEGENSATPSVRLFLHEPPKDKQTTFKTDHTKAVSEKSRWGGSQKRPASARDVMEAVQMELWYHFNRLVPPKDGKTWPPGTLSQ